jgi:SAM-dependent methyltransferase
MLRWLKGLFRRGGGESNISSVLGIEEDDLRWLDPPEDLHDVEGWDRYSEVQAKLGFALGLFDLMFDCIDLVRVMNAEGMRRVLCAGCGISQEPRALAEAGFQVTALDISPRAIEITRGLGFGAEVFETFCEPDMVREGGHVEFVVGDLFDSGVCPGPFDVITERRTAQLFAREGLEGVMGALAKRLSPEGVFLSHCHDGGWRPPAEPKHFTKPWFADNGWTIWRGGSGPKPPGRVAWLEISTG